MRILQISTHGIRCGIANYTDILADAINRSGLATCDIHPLDQESIHGCKNLRQLDAYYAGLLPVAQKYDIVHVQHEYSFFGAARCGVASANIVLGNFVRLLGSNNIKSATTFHTDPQAVAPYRFIFTPRPHKLAYRLHKLREERSSRHGLAKAFGSFPALAIVHNTLAADSLQTEYRIPRDRIHKINLGIQKRDLPLVEVRMRMLQERVSRNLSLGAGDVLLGLVGFISEYKGHLEAVRALHTLPSNYKLIIIGGKHPRDSSPFFDRLLALIHELRLEHRVHITDVFEDEDLPYYLDLTHIIIAPYAHHFRSSSAALTLGICSGRPVIASAIQSFVDIHRESPCLELHTPHCVHELAYRIRRVANDPEIAGSLVSAATAYGRANSPEAIAARHVALFRDLLSENRSP